MFTSPSRRPLVLASSCTVALVAATLAAAQPGGLLDRFEGRLGAHAPELATHGMHLSADGAHPAAPRPDPGAVRVCEEGGSNEVLVLDDPGAPGGQRPVWVHRPPGEDHADLPVLYLLHGETSSHVTLMEQGLGPLLDRQMCRTGVEFVVAAPHGQEAGARPTGWADAADGSFALESFVTGDAITAVEGAHERPRDLRAIGGFAMGGSGAAHLALRNPRLYTQAAAFSGSFGAPDAHGALGGTARDHAPDRLLDREGVGDLRFVLVEEGAREGAAGEAERFAALLAERGMTVTTDHPDGAEGFDAWKASVPGVVDFLVAGWTARG